MFLSAFIWTERKGRPRKTKPWELILIHFSYIRSRYKAFQNISCVLVSCGWFTGCDRKSISVPVDAKFITLPQNSDSPLLELQLVAMGTSARQYIFFFPQFSIGTVVYCSKNGILCNIKKPPTNNKTKPQNHCFITIILPILWLRATHYICSTNLINLNTIKSFIA